MALKSNQTARTWFTQAVFPPRSQAPALATRAVRRINVSKLAVFAQVVASYFRKNYCAQEWSPDNSIAASKSSC